MKVARGWFSSDKLDEAPDCLHSSGMHRLPRAENPRLEALLDERDHIRIQISLAQHCDLPDTVHLAALRKQLWEVDQLIKARHQA